MFKLLIESLSLDRQTEIISRSLERGGKGLSASSSFLEMPIENILSCLLTKIEKYQNSYSDKRLKVCGIKTTADISVDRIAEFLIFCRSFLSNKKEFDEKILVHFPVISYEELIFNRGGVAYGYWHLAYKINSTVTVHQLKELIQDWLEEKEKTESEPLDFFDELDSYCERKVKQLHKKTVVCYFSGEEAFPIESASSPYKVCAYSNQMQLRKASTNTNYRFASPNIKKEMALRKQCFGDDKNQKKVWVYRTIPVPETGLLMDLDYPLLSIKAHLPSVINGGHCLFSYSIMPYPIEENYLIENFPTWLYSWGCEEKGNIEDAQHILDVLDAFSCIHKVHPLGEEEESLRQHGTASNGDIGYVLHQLSKQPFNKVSCLALVKKLMA